MRKETEHEDPTDRTDRYPYPDFGCWPDANWPCPERLTGGGNNESQ